MLTYPENQEGSLTLLGEKASVKISGKALNRLEVCRGSDPAFQEDISRDNYEPTTVYGNGHETYYQRLAGFIHEPRHPEAITGDEGLKSLKVLCDIYRERDSQS